ncbi:MAG: hypothetical protein WC071_12390, partial [Victivallaceae bacterium]
ETDELFEKECAFVKKMAFANTHIFTFSPREGTPAATMQQQVPAKIAKQRYEQLDKITSELKTAFIASQLNETLNVIFEKKSKDGFAYGWSDNYINVRCPSGSVPLNRLVAITALSAGNGFIEGRLV